MTFERPLRLLSKDQMYGSITDSHAFSFSTVYICLRQNRMCLRGYSPGWRWPFWRHLVCICPLKLNKVQKNTINMLLASQHIYARSLDVTVSVQPLNCLWSMRVSNGFKILKKNVQSMHFCDDTTMTQLGEWQFCQLSQNANESLVLQCAAALVMQARYADVKPLWESDGTAV